MITLTDSMFRALQDVARQEVDFCPGMCGGHGTGFVWHCGGEVPAAEQLDLSLLVVAHLIASGVSPLRGETTVPVWVTEQGYQALSLGDIKSPPAHAAIGVSCVGGTNMEELS